MRKRNLLMRYALPLLLAGINAFPARSVDNLRLPDIRSIGMGGNVATQSPLFNPALIALQSHKSIWIDYFNKFTLKELSTMTASFYFPNSFLSTGVDISAFGYDEYREMMIRLIVGKRLHERWTFGVGIHYSYLHAPTLERTNARLSTDLGLTYAPFDKWLIGLFIVNIPSFSIGNKTIDIDDFNYYLTQIGFQWEMINSLLIAGSLGADNEHTVSGNLGIEYTAFESFFIRAGVQTAPLTPSIGVGYRLSHLKIDVAAVYHTILGVSTGIGVSFSF